MSVSRIVPNLPVTDVTAAARVYCDVLGLDVGMDMGWISTVVAPDAPGAQLSAITADATAPVTPAVSVGVTDVDDAYRRALDADVEIVYALTDEDWGVRRFFFADPDGNVINVVGHRA